ncbi:3',5'-cyclic-nucleotide phosphodiesterase [Methylobacterium sp. J-068]|uniref:3',5'-cyclic-nucleotide phosphodiesterase n=1 Tax=Methylobacterium sp. J-068 TaxID=2836649 RepID=UPI001FBB4B25|nr:3',5'-cyclic-nucleotide phosphodiesterase [Methylobacterium sp. J-068]MCJ2034713.1 3',5'-cyclic-nucleotide phosphodiesterase [Methylobacterium sp. J-068]
MALKLTSLAFVLAATASVAATPVLAQPAAQPQGAAAPQTKRGNETLKKYCTGDYLTYCGNLATDDPALDKCFQTNWTKLSENCRRAIDVYQKTDAKKKS